MARSWLFVFVLSLTAGLFAEERVALVIGNAKYDGEAALKNPANDAAAMEAALKKLDFNVTRKTDVDLAQLEDAVVHFRRTLKKNSVAFFFYAGHGLQVKGENFLVPLKATVREEFQVKDKCYKLDQVLSALDESEAALKLVVLDCCRDNPFTRSWTRGANSKGLATLEPPHGTIIAFSTAPGQTALDGRGENSPYTAQLVKSLGSRPQEGLEVKAAFFAASRAVFKDVGQRPWINLDASLDDHFLWRGEPSSSAKPSFRDALADYRAKYAGATLTWNHESGSSSVFDARQLEPEAFAKIAQELDAGERFLQIGLSASRLSIHGPPPVFAPRCDVWFSLSEEPLRAEHVAAIAKCSKIRTLWLDAGEGVTVESGAMTALAELKSVEHLMLFPYRNAVALTAQDVRDLSKSPVIETITLGGRLPDAATEGLSSFAATKNLRTLNCAGCEPSAKLTSALTALQKARPQLTIQFPEAK